MAEATLEAPLRLYVYVCMYVCMYGYIPTLAPGTPYTPPILAGTFTARPQGARLTPCCWGNVPPSPLPCHCSVRGLQEGPTRGSNSNHTKLFPTTIKVMAKP